MRPIAVTHVSTYDARGGAGIAATRLHLALRGAGAKSNHLVRFKTGNDPHTYIGDAADFEVTDDAIVARAIQSEYIDRQRTPRSNTLFSLDYPGIDIARHPILTRSDVVNLHWITSFLSIESIGSLLLAGIPVVWTLHDQHAFTGGCHYSGGCLGFMQDCSGCPQLCADPHGLASARLRDRMALFSAPQLTTLVAPSEWMRQCALRSSVFRDAEIVTIFNSVPIERLSPGSRREARRELGLDAVSPCILFGAESHAEKRKGFAELMTALQARLGDPSTAATLRRITILCFGDAVKELANSGLRVVSLGKIDEELRLRLAYVSADLFVLPSQEDNFPNTVLEALACGTPVLAFDVGGIPEAVRHGETGWLVPPGDTEALGHALTDLLGDQTRLEAWSVAARKDAVARFSPAVQSQRYLQLYDDVLCRKLDSKGRMTRAVCKNGVPRINVNRAPAFDSIFRSIASETVIPAFVNLVREHEVAEADRAARLQSVQRLEQLLAESEADRAARSDSIHQLERLLEESERDRAARLESGRRLEQLLAELEIDRAARLENVSRLERLLEESERDRAARLQSIHQLEGLLEESERDRAARLDVMKTQGAQINQLHSEIVHLTENVSRLQEITRVIQRTRVYRILRRLGRWQFMDQAPNESMGRGLPEGGQAIESHGGLYTDPALEARLQHITVDLTPLLPGAENGGAKLVAIELVRYLSRLLPDCEFVLLTSEKSHDELAYLDCSNVHRKCVAHKAQPPVCFFIPTHLRIWLQETLARLLPPSLFVRLKSLYRSFASIQISRGALKGTKTDLLFCPFTAPLFYEPSVATVCVMYDLQHRYYPQFFPAEERSHRDRYFDDVCSLASRVVCISGYVRQTVLTNSKLDPDHVVAIPIRLFSRLKRQTAETILQMLTQWTLLENDFLLYPANFWPHKNHRLLFTAFGIYCRRHPQSKLKLVCTGAADANMEKLRDAVERMVLKETIIFPGYLPDTEFAALLQSCKAVIFPSLYEGFGMPILEAMEFGKPVLCSNLTSLPEVGGDAPLYLDPRKPQEIVAAIERIVSDGDLVADMVRRGHAHLATLSGPEQMAKQYLQVFREALLSSRCFFPVLRGVYADGWTGDRIVVTYGAETGHRYLETVLHVPSWLPHDHVSITHRLNGGGLSKTQTVRRGESITIRDQLPSADGFLEIMISPTFKPDVNGFNDDDRTLGCQCRGCSIVSGSQNYDLFKELPR